MKNLKQELVQHLITEGINEKLVDIYNKFPYQGHDLTNKQKGDRVRSVYRKIKRRKICNFVDGKLKPNNIVVQKPKILVFDIETSPSRAYVFNIWKQNINPVNGMLQSNSFMICFAAKWLYSNEVIHFCLTPEEILDEDDSRITKELHELFDKAQVLIAHNARGFDIKVANTRFITHNMNPPSHYQVIDTLLHARKAFRLMSNKLDYLGQYFNLGQKNHTSFELWENCMKGDLTALKKMDDYCIQDVKLLEAVYLKMRNYIKPHPNYNLLVETIEIHCPTCGSDNYKDQGVYTTYANKYPQHQCCNCGSTFRSRKAISINKTNFTISTPN